MRTYKEYMNELLGSHDCDDCHGKIVCVSVDLLGNSCCGYCGEKVNYPKATEEELKEWQSKK